MRMHQRQRYTSGFDQADRGSVPDESADGALMLISFMTTQIGNEVGDGFESFNAGEHERVPPGAAIDSASATGFVAYDETSTTMSAPRPPVSSFTRAIGSSLSTSIV